MNASDPPPPPSVGEELAAAMEWWRAAGVDCDFTDDATAWLGAAAGPAGEEPPEPEPRAATSPLLAPAPPAPAQGETIAERMDFFAAGKPQTLDEFREFWMTTPGLDAIGSRGRVPPRGAHRPEMMVLVVDPEERDREILLSGPQGQLLKSILTATGTAPDKVYVASALPRHTPMADTGALARSGLDAVLNHHVALVAPQRILAFGAQLLPFIAETPAPAQTSLRSINYKSALPPTLTAEGLGSLLETPPLKARFWRRWMEWSAQKL